MKKRLECHIYGRVQLVMFRDFTTRKARSLGIVGTVRNMPDGSVIAVGEGEESALVSWLALLHRGPVLARVERVDAMWGEATGEFADFRICYR